MASELLQFDEMAYVGATPWHKKGIKLASLATAAEMVNAAKLGWTVRTEQVYRKIGDDYSPVDGQVTIREDTNEVLGLVGSDYVPFQNVQCFKFLDELTQDPNGPKYETAGSLKNGRLVWALAQIPKHVEILGKDKVDQYLLISTSHDGSQSITVQYTPIRVVCWNTLSWALRSGNISLKMKHTKNVHDKVVDAADVLGIVLKKQDTMANVYNAFAKKEYTKEQEDMILDKLFGVSEATKTLNKKAEVRLLAERGKGNEPFAGTFWGLYNGITEFVDYRQAMNPTTDKAFERSMFGSGARLKGDAFEMIRELVGV